MKIRHGDHWHEVDVLTETEVETVVEIDKTYEVRHVEVERNEDGEVTSRWLRDVTRAACTEGILEEV